MKRENVTIVNLESNKTRMPLRVSMESFFDFSFWLAEELDDLVAEHRFSEREIGGVGQTSSILGRRSSVDQENGNLDDSPAADSVDDRQLPKRLPVPRIKRLPR